MIVRVTNVAPEMFSWACERSGHDRGYLEKKFPKLADWENGTAHPTFKELEDFAKKTYTPFGCMFLDAPLEEPLPIPDFRILGGKAPVRPSVNLLDTIYLCLRRQEWYRDFARMSGYAPLGIAGSVAADDPVEAVAEKMRTALSFSIEQRKKCRTWTDALRIFSDQAEEAGILVMTSGVVGSNNNRRLDVAEFRGFALADDYGPVVFINGNDTKAAQMFTLAHELAHIWLGESALSDAGPTVSPSAKVERWCNKAAAEFLVPLAMIKDDVRGRPYRPEIKEALARRYKVSTLVVLLRLRDAGCLGKEEFGREYAAENERLRGLGKTSGGGDFFRTTGARVSRHFARELIASAFEGHTSFTEALNLLGIKKMSTFKKLGNELGVRV